MAIVYTDSKHYQDIANSIRAKRKSTEQYSPAEMSAAIDAITVGIDTSDATASGFDIAEGKTAYKNGGKITGVLADYTEGKTYSCVTNEDPTYIDGTVYSISSNSTILSDVILRKDSTISMLAKAESFGDAKPEDVLEGKTFTSASGLKVEGTATSVGIDTYDATATANDIAKNKTAYVDGEKVTGTLQDIDAGVLQMNTAVPEEYAGVYYSVSDVIGDDKILRKGVKVKMTMDKTGFGTATAADVVSGKTFTSENGYSITGTHVCESGIDTSDANATETDILSGKTAYVNGSKITGAINIKTENDLSSSGATVIVPAGYYASQSTKSVVTATQATPTIDIDSSGKITASSSQTAGYVTSGTKSATRQLITQGDKTITPSAASQTAVTSGIYTTGTVTVSGDTNLASENIVEGVSIFNVTGNAEPASALADELSTQNTLIADIMTALEGKAAGSTINIAYQNTGAQFLISSVDSTCYSISFLFPGVSSISKLVAFSWEKYMNNIGTLHLYWNRDDGHLCCVINGNGTIVDGLSFSTYDGGIAAYTDDIHKYSITMVEGSYTLSSYSDGFYIYES